MLCFTCAHVLGIVCVVAPSPTHTFACTRPSEDKQLLKGLFKHSYIQPGVVDILHKHNVFLDPN